MSTFTLPRSRTAPPAVSCSNCRFLSGRAVATGTACPAFVQKLLSSGGAHSRSVNDLVYIAFVFAGSVVGTMLGIAAHYWRAHATLYAEKLFDDGDFANGLFMDDYLYEKHVVGAEWDDAGFWAADSVRNLVYYMLSGCAVPVILGLMFWDDRTAVVAAVCQVIASPLCI